MRPYRFILAILIATIASLFPSAPASGQVPPAPAAAPVLNQQQQAMAAMQSSLAQQQAALDTSRESAQTSSLAQQRQSVLKQIQPVEPVSMAPISKPGPVPVETVEAPKSPGFFTADWPSAVPLSVPNVQVVDESCQALKGDEVDKLIETASKAQSVDPALLKSVMRQESAFKPCALSVAGAMGLMQIMPDTADMLGLDDPFDPQKNVAAGAKFLKMMLQRYGGDISMALGAYNAGPGTVDRAGGVPPIAETIQYVSNVLGGLPFAY